MNKNKSVLTFHDYYVIKMEYNKNVGFISDGNQLDVTLQFLHDVLKTETNYEVTLGVKILASEELPTPFNIEVIIIGVFSLEVEDDVFIKENAVAILFPYLRSIVTTITANANIAPLVLPTVNVAEMLATKEE